MIQINFPVSNNLTNIPKYKMPIKVGDLHEDSLTKQWLQSCGSMGMYLVHV